MSLISGRKVIFLVLFLASPFYILYLIYHYGINVPFWDQWELVPLLKKVHTYGLTFSDIWAQHNEHRVFFPRLIMLSLAYLTNWNIMFELYTNLILAALILLILCILLRQTFDKQNSIPAWLFIIFSFLIFSPTQWGNWTWGWQLHIFLSVLASVVAVWAVSKWSGKLRGFIVAMVSAVIASYSFNSGLLTWVIVIMLLMIQKEWHRKHIILWMSAFIVTTALYSYEYWHPPLLSFMNRPYKYIWYVLACLGSPLGYG